MYSQVAWTFDTQAGCQGWHEDSLTWWWLHPRWCIYTMYSIQAFANAQSRSVNSSRCSMPRNVWSRHLRKWSRLVSPSQPSPRCNCAIGGLSASLWHSPGCSVTLRSLLTDAAETEVANNLLHFHSNYLWAADMPHISEPNTLSRIIARFLRIKRFKRMSFNHVAITWSEPLTSAPTHLVHQ